MPGAGRASGQSTRASSANGDVSTYLFGGPKPFGDKLSSATTATPAVAADNPQHAVVTAVIPPQQKKQANKRAVTKKSPLPDKLALELKELKLSVRASNVLKREGFKTVGDLRSKTAAALRAYDGFGQKSVDEVKAKLAAIGLTLKGDTLPKAA